MRMTTPDREYTIAPIVLNGQELLRVTCASLANAPLHADGRTRSATVRMAAGWHVADVRTPAELAALGIDLATLEEA